MKSLFLFFLCLLYYINISAQYADSSLTQSSDLLLKAKKQYTVGWILLGGGAGIAAAGLVVGTATIWTNIIEGDDTGTTIGEVMIITGLVSMVSSIPVPI